jgi:hypothetical protein
MDARGGAIGETLETAKVLLATERGRAARAAVAAGIIVAAPIVMRLPVVRAHPLGRLVALAGGAAVLIKAAEAIRDWEPELRVV